MSSSDMNPMNSSSIPTVTPFEELQESFSDLPLIDNVSVPTGSPSSPSSSASKKLPESQRTQPKGMAGKSNFVNTVTAIFKEDDIDVPISIFKVPNSLTSTKPEAYVPQTVSLGPVHHSRRELQHMDMYKVMEAKRIHKGFQSGFEFEKVIEFLEQLVGGPSMRASYCIYFNMEDDELACVMAIDGLFLIDLVCSHGADKEALANSGSLCHLVSPAGRRLAQETIIQEAMMLENQIPISVIKVLLIIECSEMTTVSDFFPEILLGFCKFVSPLETLENYPLYKALKHAHLLDLLYHLVTLKHSPRKNLMEEAVERMSLEELSNKVRPKKQDFSVQMMPITPEVKMLICETVNIDPDQIISNMFDAAQTFAPQQFLLPLRLIQSLFGKLPQFRSIIYSAVKKETPAKKVLSFPTASELHRVGVKFSVVDRIANIGFDPEEASFKLPIITLNAYFEVVIRNLVAFEAMIKSDKEPPILNWYVELMNGLIKTAQDVEVLRDQDIISKPDSINEEQSTEGISSKLESLSDEQVAKIFSGMNKSVELTNIPKELEDTVRSVKRHYAKKQSAMEEKFMVKCRKTAATWCNFFLVLLALFLLGVQSVCSVYECPRFSFKTSNTSPPVQQDLRLPSLRSHLM